MFNQACVRKFHVYWKRSTWFISRTLIMKFKLNMNVHLFGNMCLLAQYYTKYYIYICRLKMKLLFYI